MRGQRGVTLIETMIAMGVMLVGLLGMAHMQVLAARANDNARRVAHATALAQDLAQAIGRWEFSDPRLDHQSKLLDSMSDSRLSKLDLGRTLVVQTALKPQFSDSQDDVNANIVGQLGTYQGVPSDVDRDGQADFGRYWTVFGYDPDKDGTINGKLAVIVVRWKEPGYGYRQVTMTTFKFNPAVLSL